VALSSRYHRLTVGGPSTLDERELALRYRTSTAAFSIYALITVLGCVYLRSARWLGLPAPAGAGWLWVMIVLGNLFALLPIIILEWSADSLASEEEE
jgi:hypothetical protein